MKRKILALMLIFAMTLSLAACKTTDDEENAVADEVVSDNGSDNQDDNNDTNQPDDNDTNEPDNNNDNDNNDNNDDDEDNTPPLSTEGKYTVTFDFGYDGKSESEKTNGTVTEIDASRNGFTFDGWFNGNDKWDFSATVSKSMTLKAKWTAIEYKITYKANGATIPSTNPTSYTADEEHKLYPATMKGKVFYGWSIDTGKETFTSDIIPKGTYGDLIITPVWDDSIFIFGKYEQDGNTDNGKENIEWIKLKEENGKALFISNKILDAKQYDSSSTASIKWANSSLRNWLNENFYKTAFSDSEQKAIVKTQIQTPGVHDNSTSNDYVFLLSLEEVGTVLTSYTSRRAKVTPYAEANGVQNSELGGWWWLRTKISDYGAALIENDGNIRSIGYNGNLKTIGVRPCIWVDLSKIS